MTDKPAIERKQALIAVLATAVSRGIGWMIPVWRKLLK